MAAEILYLVSRRQLAFHIVGCPNNKVNIADTKFPNVVNIHVAIKFHYGLRF